MALESKTRAALRSRAQNLSPVVMVGHDGLSEGVIEALNKALDDHELVKVRFQDFKDSTKTLSQELEKATGSDLVATTGFTAVFYRRNKKE